jgi:hypothetical protein
MPLPAILPSLPSIFPPNNPFPLFPFAATGTLRQSFVGEVRVVFKAAGVYYFTSPKQNQCDTKWIAVKVLPPPPLGA